MRIRLLPADDDIGWTPFAWLIYLAPLFIVPYFEGAGALEWTVTLAGAAVFLALYFRGYWLRGRRLLRVVAAIAVLGLVMTPFNSVAVTFFIYAAAFVGNALKPRPAWLTVLGLEAVLVAAILLLRVPPGSWIPAVVFTILIGGLNIHFCEVSRRNARLRLAQDEVAHLARLEERERIARDLHDLLGHSLSVVTVKSQLVDRLLARGERPDLERSREEIRDIERVSREAAEEVRRAVSGYREQKLGTEITKARMALDSVGIDLELESSPYELAAHSESVAALCLREAVTNVIRHARATSTVVRIRQERGRLTLEVEDDGRGIRGEPGSGLSGMRERVEALGGTVAIGRPERGGARLRIVLPTGAAEAPGTFDRGAAGAPAGSQVESAG